MTLIVSKPLEWLADALIYNTSSSCVLCHRCFYYNILVIYGFDREPSLVEEKSCCYQIHERYLA